METSGTCGIYSTVGRVYDAFDEMQLVACVVTRRDIGI